jgi:diguanylate cyclase (GGDEF)-like protein
MSDDDEVTGSRPTINLMELTGKSSPTLTVLSGGDQIGKRYTLDLVEIVIGRAADAHIRIDDDGVSRYHARLMLTSEGVLLEDLKSKNGTLLNGTPVRTATLSPGNTIQIGPRTVLRFALEDSLEVMAARKLFDQATRDVLTGLYNRTYLVETMVKEFAFSVRHRHPLSVALLDIDRFKVVNDTHGHAGGDAVLRSVADVLQATVRQEDVVGRFGGEEFLIIARQLSARQSLQLAERLRKAIAACEVSVGAVRVPVTASLGVATMTADRFGTWQDLVDAADRALYEAKKSGRNRVCVAEPTAPPD